MAINHVLPITIYYEDTDFSGVVYHANFLKYFERSREEMLGIESLVSLYRDRGLGFVVHRVEMTFKAPAIHGDRLEVRTYGRKESDYRLSFDQSVWRIQGNVLLVQGQVQLVTIDRAGQLVPVPRDVADRFPSTG